MTGVRAGAVSAFLALLLTALTPAGDLLGVGPSLVLRLLALLGAAFAVVMIVLAWRRDDLAALLLGGGVVLRVLAAELPPIGHVVLVTPGQVLLLASVALIGVAGVLVRRRSRGWQRVTGAVVAALALARLLFLVVTMWSPLLLAVPQENLLAVFAIAPALELATLVVAATLFVPAVFGRVGRGAKWLWETAAVR